MPLPDFRQNGYSRKPELKTDQSADTSAPTWNRPENGRHRRAQVSSIMRGTITTERLYLMDHYIRAINAPQCRTEAENYPQTMHGYNMGCVVTTTIPGIQPLRHVQLLWGPKIAADLSLCFRQASKVATTTTRARCRSTDRRAIQRRNGTPRPRPAGQRSNRWPHEWEPRRKAAVHVIETVGGAGTRLLMHPGSTKQCTSEIDVHL